MKPPTKWHLARVGLLTWFIGLISGWMLFATPGPTVLHVPGARSVSVECQGYSGRIDGPEIPLSGRAPCSVEADMNGGDSASGELRVTLRGTHTCRASGETLTCASSLP